MIDEACSRLRLEQESKPEIVWKVERDLLTKQIEQSALANEGDDAKSKARKEVVDGEVDALVVGLMDVARPEDPYVAILIDRFPGDALKIEVDVVRLFEGIPGQALQGPMLRVLWLSVETDATICVLMKLVRSAPGLEVSPCSVEDVLEVQSCVDRHKEVTRLS